MASKFESAFRVTDRVTNSGSGDKNSGSLPPESLHFASDFLLRHSGCTYNDGLYRMHLLSDLSKWNELVAEAFPSFQGRFQCFSFDWLGRHFAIDLLSNKVAKERTVLMFDIGAGEALEIPATFSTFHEDELVDYQDAALAADFFSRWRQLDMTKLQHEQCVGYRRPLFVGGKDDVTNLHISDMEVYWSVTGQLFAGLS